MNFGMIGAGTLSRAMEDKHVAALLHCQAQQCETPPCLDHDGGAAR